MSKSAQATGALTVPKHEIGLWKHVRVKIKSAVENIKDNTAGKNDYMLQC